MYTKFYGFKEKPFNIVSDPGFLYMSPKHSMALTYLEYGLLDGVGFILLTGEIGTGKTTLIKSVLKKIRSRMDVAVVFNTNVSAKELLVLIIEEFELEVPQQGKGGYLDVLNQFLINKHGQGRRVLLIVDEAQNLSQEALEEIRMLSNLQTEKASLLQILLVGQPALRNRLQDPSLSQLSQRIAVSYHLRSLDLEETHGYIAHRLKTAGREKAGLFSSEAVESVFQYSMGIPRMINILCDAALVYGYADELSVIEGNVIDSVIQDREESGMAAPGLAPVQGGPQGEQGDTQNGLKRRVESLEQQVQSLSSLADWQIRELESRAEGYKDTLVQKLEGMLAEERRRVDRLLVQYNLLRDRLNLKKLRSRGNRVEDKAAGDPALGLSGATHNSVVENHDSSGSGPRWRKWFSR